MCRTLGGVLVTIGVGIFIQISIRRSNARRIIARAGNDEICETPELGGVDPMLYAHPAMRPEPDDPTSIAHRYDEEREFPETAGITRQSFIRTRPSSSSSSSSFSLVSHES